MLEGLSTEQLSELKAAFRSLNSIEEKFEFWLKKLNKPYYFNSYEDHQTILDFLIKAKSEEDNFLINSLSLEDIRKYGFFFNLQLLNINDKIEDFEQKLSSAKNKRVIIDNEIKLISEDILKHQESENDIFKLHENQFWITGYTQSYINHEELDLSKGTYEAKNLIQLNNGYITGEYFKYLDKLTGDLNNNREFGNHLPTTVKQQVLILESLGLLQVLEKRLEVESKNGVKLNKNLIKLLASMLNRGEQSIKEALTNLPKKAMLYDIKTVNNYQFIENLFLEVGLDKTAEIIKNEKDKLKQGK